MAGFYEGSDLADKTFYGFRLNPDDGGLVVEKINDGSPVILPEDGITGKYDYKQWFWTRDTVQFQWAPNGHLQARFL